MRVLLEVCKLFSRLLTKECDHSKMACVHITTYLVYIVHM